MKIKQETLKVLMARFKAALAFFLSIVATCHVSVSRGNKKIGHVLNVSLPPVMTCGNCSGCANTCYAVKNAIRRGRIVINCWARNYAVLLADRPAGYYCPGNCNICRDNGRGCVVGESTKVNEH